MTTVAQMATAANDSCETVAPSFRLMERFYNSHKKSTENVKRFLTCTPFQRMRRQQPGVFVPALEIARLAL